MIVPVLILAALALLAPPRLHAQPPDQPRAFRSGVELVRLDVRVVDETGRPVRDLRPDEVEIYDDGRRLPVVLFQRVAESAETYVDDAMRATTAEVSSNAAFPRGHLYILIFDQQHITPGNEGRARLAAERFIRHRVRPSDRVAMYAVPGPGPQVGFTADKGRLLKELASIRGAYERVVFSPLGTMTVFEAHRIVQRDERLIAQVMERVAVASGADLRPDGREDAATARRLLEENARTIVSQTDSGSRDFLQRLSDIIAAFRDIEGRKTVVLFSEGFFQDNLSRELEAVAAAAAQSYCVVQAFDLNRRGVSLADAYPSDTTIASEVHARIAPLATLAAETDGSLVLDARGRSAEELDRLAEQAQEYYLVGFTPPAEALQKRGRYRRVDVKVTRPRARASTRTGYATAPDGPGRERRRSIDMALAAPFVQQGLQVDYTTYEFRGTERGRQRVVLALEAELPVRSTGADRADVVFVVRDVRDGRVVASGTDTMPLPAGPRPGAALGTSDWRVQFELPAGSYLMRAVVREPGGLVGTADRRLEVDALDGPGVALSDLVVGSSAMRVPVRATARVGDGLTGVVEAYAGTAQALRAVEVRMELRPAGAADTVAVAAAELSPVVGDGAGSKRLAQLMLPLTGVLPGEYEVRAVAQADGRTVGERTRHVEILPGSAAHRLGDASTGEEWTPGDLIEGYLGRRYLAWLEERGSGTPVARAARLARENRWSEASVALQGAPPDDRAALALKALVSFAQAEFEEAAAEFQLARGDASDDALTAFFLGWACEGAGDTRGALGAWRTAAHLDPTLVSAHLALAEGYLRINERALAVQALKAGLARLPSSVELRAKLEQVERGGR